jgi:LysM repeat protein
MSAGSRVLCLTAFSVFVLTSGLLAGCTAQPGGALTTGDSSSTSSPRPSASSQAEAQSPAFDGGPTQGAEGSSSVTSSGHYVYVVASGDTPFAIASRFGLCLADLYGSNPGLDGHQSDLYVGQHLTIGRVRGPYHDTADCLSGIDESDAYP